MTTPRRDPRTDHELLRCHADRRDRGEAFAELVARHGDMVYAAAVRQVGRSGLADDVAQATFVLLARKAGRLPESIVVAAWLHKATRYAALNAMRMERRRRDHERRAADERLRAERKLAAHRSTADLDGAWTQGAALLDEGVARLGAGERDAVVLRYLERRSFAEVGAALGVSEAAAQMRVGRALEKLRAFFRRRGLVMTAATMRAAIDANAIAPAPTALKQSIARAVRAGDGGTGAAAAQIAEGAGRSMRWATVRAAGAAGAGGLAAAAALALLLTRLVANPAPTNAASAPATRPAVAESNAARTWRDGPLGPMAARVDEMLDVPTLAERSRHVERVAIVERAK